MTSYDSLAAMNAAAEENFAKVQDQNDAEGAFARSKNIADEFNHYFIRELQRCGRDNTISASINLLSCMVAIVASAHHGDPNGPERRRVEALAHIVQLIGNMAINRTIAGDGVIINVAAPR